MTQVDFHFNVPDRLHYACRLLRKATRTGAGVAVCGPAPTLAALDRMLWTFEPQEFVPHVLLRETDTAPAPRLARTPVWLVPRAELAAHHPVLVHLGDEPAQGFESFVRLIEIVSTDAEGREAARRRWKHYAARGYEIRTHEAGGAA